MYRNIFVDIDTSKIEANARLMSETFGQRYSIAVVKGNAYGHGYGIVPALVKGGMNAFAVSSLDEALEVRKLDREHPVLLLQPVDVRYLDVCSKEDISVVVSDTNSFDKIVESGLKLKLQFKVNCGMNRLGYKASSLLERDIKRAQESDKLFVEGIFSHFHTSGLTDTEYRDNKLNFENITKNIDLSQIPMVHLDKTQTVLLHETPKYCTGVRFGLSLYGFSSIYPYDSSLKGRLLSLRRDIKNRLKGVEPTKELKSYDLKPAFSLKTTVIALNDVAAGEYVGYGLLHKAERNERIAVIDAGYADGIGRGRSGSNVSINGKKFKIVGEIGMGMCEVLVDESVSLGDTVTVLGDEISIRGIAGYLKTTTYEVLTNINSLIQRRYL